MTKEIIKKVSFISLMIFIVALFLFDDNFKKNLKWDYLKIANIGDNNWSQVDSVFSIFSEDEINNAKININDFQAGGVAKDDIPSLINPNFDSATSTTFEDTEKIIGVYLNGEARAYPYSILYWHEIINDTIGKSPISVTLCPLCNTSAVFSRIINGEITSFGVSGKLFNSCLIMHDRQTNSLWSQVWGMGVMGKNNNYQLEKIISYTTTLETWKKIHPDTLVLSIETGHERDYNKYPYGDYLVSSKLRFSARNQSELKVNPKDTIYFINKNNENQEEKNTFEGEAWQISKKELIKEKSINFNFNNKNYSAKWDETLETAKFYNEIDEEIPYTTAFAFVYPAYFIDINNQQ